MDPYTILAALPGPGPHERLQVGLVQRKDGRVAIDLRQQHYAEGIGWFDQRSIALDPRQVKQLQAVLGMQSETISAFEADTPAILAFPGPSDEAPRRTAAGGEG